MIASYIGTVYIFCTSLWQARAIEIREIGIGEIARLQYLEV